MLREIFIAREQQHDLNHIATPTLTSPLVSAKLPWRRLALLGNHPDLKGRQLVVEVVAILPPLPRSAKMVHCRIVQLVAVLQIFVATICATNLAIIEWPWGGIIAGQRYTIRYVPEDADVSLTGTSILYWSAHNSPVLRFQSCRESLHSTPVCHGKCLAILHVL